jgi:hypothetical protein
LPSKSCGWSRSSGDGAASTYLAGFPILKRTMSDANSIEIHLPESSRSSSLPALRLMMLRWCNEYSQKGCSFFVEIHVRATAAVLYPTAALHALQGQQTIRGLEENLSIAPPEDRRQ